MSVPLKTSFNNILETGIFPDEWKRVKKKDKKLIRNYRPIHLLILAKLFEKIIFRNPQSYCEKLVWCPTK